MTGFDDDQVFKYLGKYQLDTKLALLSQQVIKDSQSANPALEKQSQYWSALHTSWPEHLLALFKQPDLPLLDSQDILQINASHNTVISRTNSQREHHHADMKTQQSEIFQDIRASEVQLHHLHRELRDCQNKMAKVVKDVDPAYNMLIASGTP